MEAYLKSVDKDDMVNKISQLGIAFDPGTVSEGVGQAPAAAPAAAPTAPQPQAPAAQAPLPGAVPPPAQQANPAPGGPGYADPFDQYRQGR